MESCPITYEELHDLENEFDDVEIEIMRQQAKLSKPLYEKRQAKVSQIPNFWPLVIEQAPEEIDEFIQPTDSKVLVSSLTSLSVARFEVDDGGTSGKGDPRSVAIRFEFAENDYFDDKVLEKKFWYRRSLDGWYGLVSEPVDIKWKKGKDLTSGLLGMAKRVWAQGQAEKERAKNNKTSEKKSGGEALTAQRMALKKKLEDTALGGLSFFAWFGYVGKEVPVEESREATRRETQRREFRRQGKEVPLELKDAENDEDRDADKNDDSLEIFPDGENIAIAIAEELWPNAIKYFTQAQEQDAASDDDFESDEGGTG